MKFIPNAVTCKVSRQLLVAQKHSPTLLFIGGVAGVVATTVTACRSTLRLEEVLLEIQADKTKAKDLHEANIENYTDQDYKKDMAYLYVRSVVKVTKLYGPSILLGAVSIAALTGSHNILSKRNTALTAAYAAVEKSYRDYRGRVVEEFGEDKDRELRYGTETREVVVEETNGPKKKKIKTVSDRTPNQYARFFEEFNTNWSPQPEYNMLFLRAKQSYLNQRLSVYGHVFLNEVYDELGLERSSAGAVVGWLKDGEGDGYIDFGIWDGQDMLKFHDFVTGREGGILLDFNVDGTIYDKI